MKNRRSRINHEKAISEKLIAPKDSKEEASAISFFAEVIAIIILSWCAVSMYTEFKRTIKKAFNSYTQPHIELINAEKSEYTKVKEQRYIPLSYNDFIKQQKCEVIGINCEVSDTTDYTYPESEREMLTQKYLKIGQISSFSSRYIETHDCKKTGNTCTAIEVEIENSTKEEIGKKFEDRQEKEKIVDCLYENSLKYKSFKEYINLEWNLYEKRNNTKMTNRTSLTEEMDSDFNELERREARICEIKDLYKETVSQKIIRKNHNTQQQ